jgi:hypothetical protein
MLDLSVVVFGFHCCNQWSTGYNNAEKTHPQPQQQPNKPQKTNQTQNKTQKTTARQTCAHKTPTTTTKKKTLLNRTI